MSVSLGIKEGLVNRYNVVRLFANVNVDMTSQIDQRLISLTVTRWQNLPWAFCCCTLKLFVWKACLRDENVFIRMSR